MAGRPWPVCARCAGIYLGAAAAALLIVILVRSGKERLGSRGAGAPARLTPQWMLGLAVLPAVLTLLWEWTTGVTPSNAVRATTGALIGVVVTWLLMRALRAERTLGVN